MVTPEEMERIYSGQVLQQQLGQNALATQQQLMFQEQERGLAEEQLDVEEILERICNLLQGNEYKDIGQGVKQWIENKDPKSKILSDWGVQRMMQIARFHINKNTLLSNFSEEQINRIMYDCTTEMNDLFLLKYKQLLREATFEECKKILDKKIENRKDVMVYTLEILGKKSDSEQIKKLIFMEMEGKIERELKKIKDEELSERIKEYGIILWEVEQAIYSTFNRAYMGKERETLRRHASFSEVRSLSPEIQKKGGITGWLKS